MNQIKIFPVSAFKDNYIWMIVDTDNQQAIAVDPGEAAPVIDYLNQHQLALAGILITHHHWDHTNGILALKELNACPVAGPVNEKIMGITQPAHHEENIQFPHFPLSFTVMAIPGHTLDHLAYYACGMLFCGDTLFGAGCGRLFEGTADDMYTSLQKITALPEDTQIFCGHEYTLANLRFAKTVEPQNMAIDARIKKVESLRENKLPSLPSHLHEEKVTNPFLRCHSSEIIANVRSHFNNNVQQAVDVFAALRQWKDNFKF